MKIFKDNWEILEGDIKDKNIKISFTMSSVSLQYISDKYLLLRKNPSKYFVFLLGMRKDEFNLHNHDDIPRRFHHLGINTKSNIDLEYHAGKNGLLLSRGIRGKGKIQEKKITDELIENYLLKELI